MNTEYNITPIITFGYAGLGQIKDRFEDRMVIEEETGGLDEGSFWVTFRGIDMKDIREIDKFIKSELNEGDDNE